MNWKRRGRCFPLYVEMKHHAMKRLTSALISPHYSVSSKISHRSRDGAFLWSERGAEKAFKKLGEEGNGFECLNMKQEFNIVNRFVTGTPQYKKWKQVMQLNQGLEPGHTKNQPPLWDETWFSPIYMMRQYMTDFFKVRQQFKQELKGTVFQGSYGGLDDSILQDKTQQTARPIIYNLAVTDEFFPPAITYLPKGYELQKHGLQDAPLEGLIYHDWSPYPHGKPYPMVQEAMIRPSKEASGPAQQYEPTLHLEEYIQRKLKADGFKHGTHYMYYPDNSFLNNNPFKTE
jgi:hypothetical protein